MQQPVAVADFGERLLLQPMAVLFRNHRSLVTNYFAWLTVSRTHSKYSAEPATIGTTTNSGTS